MALNSKETKKNDHKTVLVIIIIKTTFPPCCRNVYEPFAWGENRGQEICLRSWRDDRYPSSHVSMTHMHIRQHHAVIHAS